MIIKNDLDLVYPYTYDSSNMKGYAEMVYIPENLDEMRDTLKKLYRDNIKITISGAGTGITGSRVPFGGAVISTEKLKKVYEIGDDYIVIEPGITLSELDEVLKPYNLFLPPNPTEINASVGGNIATNASGARTFKYGAIRNWITELEVILSDGDSINLKRGEHLIDKDKDCIIVTNSNKFISFELPDYKMPDVKNASGYFYKPYMDLIDLFIGSEGTLGVFGKIKLKLLKRPEHLLGGIVFFDDNSKLFEFVYKLRELSLKNNKLDYNECKDVSSRLIEYLDANSLNLLRNKFPQIPIDAKGAVWFEQEFNYDYEDILMEKWYNLIENYTDLSEHTWIASNDNEHERLREFRHELPLQVYENLTNNSQKKVGLDTAVPDDRFIELFNFYLNRFKNIKLEYVIFGHIGNCHLHANIFCQNEEEYSEALSIYDECIDLTLKLGGTVSAEHGIGKLKKRYLIKMYGDDVVSSMKSIKKQFDPKYLLNVGTMFD